MNTSRRGRKEGALPAPLLRLRCAASRRHVNCYPRRRAPASNEPAPATPSSPPPSNSHTLGPLAPPGPVPVDGAVVAGDTAPAAVGVPAAVIDVPAAIGVDVVAAVPVPIAEVVASAVPVPVVVVALPAVVEGVVLGVWPDTEPVPMNAIASMAMPAPMPTAPAIFLICLTGLLLSDEYVASFLGTIATASARLNEIRGSVGASSCL
ncbi:MAG: hypothetical protein IVW36_00545 [Dehalococcoidia bacterium]|nr:hypothetical protein [Dehalococcoidia bacterium]